MPSSQPVKKHPAPAGEGGITQIAVDLIQRNPRQPREKFDIEELENLAASIREHGVIQPLIVSPGKNGIYILIAGERRLQAARKAGLKTVPVVIRHATDQQLLELALIENVQRADLNAIEEAEAYQHLAKEFKLSHETIATRVGKSRVAVTNTTALARCLCRGEAGLGGWTNYRRSRACPAGVEHRQSAGSSVEPGGQS